MKNRKLYFARFTDTRNSQQFYKIGQCYQYDAAERFKVEPDQYKNYDIKIMASAWGPPTEVDLWEQELLGIKEKDFWVEGKFSGITEIRKFDSDEVRHIISKLKTLNTIWYKIRHKDSCVT